MTSWLSAAYEQRNFYGVQEDEAGNELEIDHFQPVSKGGGDELTNLVYCRTACNRNKGDFWPLTEQQALLPPARDDYATRWPGVMKKLNR